MKLYHKVLLSLFYVVCGLLVLYSFVLFDPNLSIGSIAIEKVRGSLLQFGYYQRQQSSLIYLSFIVLLFAFQLYFIKNVKKISVASLIIPLSLLCLFSYPFLSHDLFNYMFDARILTHYGQNPYFHKALDFPTDSWLRFMRWTHRNYPYGPTFLPITLIPSYLGLGKFFVTLLLFKAVFLSFYLGAVYYLNKLNRRWALFFATSPLVIIEGLVNTHNDMIALSLGIIGIYFIFKKRTIVSRIFFLLSIGIKYISFPYLFLMKEKKSVWNKVALAAFIAILIYLSFWQEIEPWYFLGLLAFLPFFEDKMRKLWIFFAGILFSYYPLIRFGDGTKDSQIILKHEIIAVFFILNVIYAVYSYLRPRKT